MSNVQASPTPANASPTVVISLGVRHERLAEYEAWQERINAAARAFPGFEGLEVLRPSPGVQDDWVVVFRYKSASELAAWLDSESRRALVAEGEPYFEHIYEDVIATPERTVTVTLVASHRVKPGYEAEFERWLAGITAAARVFPGFLGSESLPPVAGVQADWVVVLRFAAAPSLQHWIESDVRAAWIQRAEPFLETVTVHRVAAGLGGWFPSPLDQPSSVVTPPDWKQAMAVLLALYPVVMLLTLHVSPRLDDLPLAVNMFIGNVISVALLQWALMPPLTRALQRWLEATTPTRTWLGTFGLLGVYAAMVAAFVPT